MTPPLARTIPSRLILPPAFTGIFTDEREDGFAKACRIAAPDRAGSLIVAERADVLDFAVVLAPDEPLVSARRALLVGMTALADAVGTHAAPEVPIGFDWPDTLRFDGARLGGGRLAWPEDCAGDAVPDWLVFSAMLVVSKAIASDPGLTPDSTSLEEEGVSAETCLTLVESFARNLMKSFEVWAEDGFDPIGARYLSRLLRTGAHTGRIDRNGDLLIGAERFALAPALHEPSWRDPTTGRVRL